MAELAGLSVAANVAQLVLIGWDGTRYLASVYNNDKAFLQTRNEGEAVARSISDAVDNLKRDRDLMKDERLRELVNLATQLAQELSDELDKIQTGSRRGRVGRLELAFKSLRKRTQIESLQARLSELSQSISQRLVYLSSVSRGTYNMNVYVGDSSAAVSNYQVNDKLDELYQQLAVAQEGMETSSREHRKELLREMADKTAQTVRDCLLCQRAETVLRSLQFPHIAHRQSEIPQAHSQTFGWAFEEERTPLGSWLRSGNGVFWIEGKAGSGKSTLMKFLDRSTATTRHLEAWSQGKKILLISHYFWASGTRLQCSLTGLLRTLLFKILMKCPELLDVLCPGRMTSANNNHLDEWSLEELADMFSTICKLDNLPSKICFLIDGLDEYQGDYSVLIKLLESTGTSTEIKMCVSSRPWSQFQQAFGSLPSKLRVHDLTKDDIAHYIQDHLRNSSLFKVLESRSPDEARSLQEEIAQAADGVFLWVFLATRDILRGLTNRDDVAMLRRRLRDTPRDLEDYFLRMLNTIEPVYHFESSAIFSMLAFAQHHFPLTTGHLWAYCRGLSLPLDFSREPHCPQREPDPAEVEHHRQRLFARCGDLVSVSEEGKTVLSGAKGFVVVFLHRTVADFLHLPKTKAVLSEGLSHPPGVSCNALTTGAEFLPAAGLARAFQILLQEADPEDREQLFDLCKWILWLANDFRIHSVAARSGAQNLAMWLINKFTDTNSPLLQRCHTHVAESTRFKLVLPLLSATLGLGLSHAKELLDMRTGMVVSPSAGRTTQDDGWLDRELSDNRVRLFQCKDCFHNANMNKVINACLSDALLGAWDIAVEDHITTMRRSDVDLPLLEYLWRLAMSKAAGRQGEQHELEYAWFECVQAILARFNRVFAPRNIYDAIQLLVKLGAPRYIAMSTIGEIGKPGYLETESQGVLAWEQYWERGRTRVLPNPSRNRVHSAETIYYFDTAFVLERIPHVCARSRGSLASQFRVEFTPEQEGAQESFGWLSWLTGRR